MPRPTAPNAASARRSASAIVGSVGSFRVAGSVFAATMPLPSASGVRSQETYPLIPRRCQPQDAPLPAEGLGSILSGTTSAVGGTGWSIRAFDHRGGVTLNPLASACSSGGVAWRKMTFGPTRDRATRTRRPRTVASGGTPVAIEGEATEIRPMGEEAPVPEETITPDPSDQPLTGEHEAPASEMRVEEPSMASAAADFAAPDRPRRGLRRSSRRRRAAAPLGDTHAARGDRPRAGRSARRDSLHPDESGWGQRCRRAPGPGSGLDPAGRRPRSAAPIPVPRRRRWKAGSRRSKARSPM